MPGYLSQGSLQYNQVRKINSKDPLARLDYYLPSSSTSSSSSSSRYSAFLAQTLAQNQANIERESSESYRSSIASSSDYSHERKVRNRKRSHLIQPICEYSSTKSSPLESSGFSEGGTVVGGTFRETFVKPNQVVDLADSSIISRKNALELELNNKLSYDKSKLQNEKSLESNNGEHRIIRMKRRNINRRDRRILMGGEELVNPYALSELFSQSEIPGFREIFASDSYLRKFCWIVAFIFMTVLSLNDITALITEYYEFPITVDVRLRDSARLPFPSVTVCNLNVVRFSALCSTAGNSRPDLSSQIPSDIRDKLCGLQLEKKNNSGGADIGDINNIGITTTSTTTTTAASSTIPSSVSNSLGSTLPGLFSSTNIPSTQTSVISSSTARRTTSGGGLDLGDFSADPALLLTNQAAHHQLRSRRTIQVKELEGRAHPFASTRERVRVRNRISANHQQQPDRLAANKLPSVEKQQIVSTNVMRNPGGNQAGTGRQPASPSGFNPMLMVPTTSAPSPSVPLTLVPPIMSEEFELTERQERELQENLTNWLAVMWNRDPQFTGSLGHQFDDMILRCTMKSVNCTHQRSFENSFTPTEGNCFNYRSKVRRKRTGAGDGQRSSTFQFDEANLAGTNNGLELVLNLEKSEYLSSSSQVGALVMIHHPSDLGYAASEATFVAPEVTTYIGLKMVNITRLPAPYPESCIDSWPKKFAIKQNSTYSQQACLKICLQKTIQSHCLCQSAFLPVLEIEGGQKESKTSSQSTQVKNPTLNSSVEDQPQRLIICDTRKWATRQCVKEVMSRASDRVHNCECPPKCQVVRYDRTISTAKWPTKEDKVSFDRGKMDINFQNLAKVIVYFQTMTCEEISQQAVFNAAKLFSALGGIMGMYVGFSFLSVFEIFEVMSRKTWHHFRVKLESKNSPLMRDLH